VRERERETHEEREIGNSGKEGGESCFKKKKIENEEPCRQSLLDTIHAQATLPYCEYNPMTAFSEHILLGYLIVI
jgi:hypothetical protein